MTRPLVAVLAAAGAVVVARRVSWRYAVLTPPPSRAAWVAAVTTYHLLHLPDAVAGKRP